MDGYIDKCWRWTAIIWLSSTAPSLPCRLLNWDLSLKRYQCSCINALMILDVEVDKIITDKVQDIKNTCE